MVYLSKIEITKESKEYYSDNWNYNIYGINGSVKDIKVGMELFQLSNTRILYTKEKVKADIKSGDLTVANYRLSSDDKLIKVDAFDAFTKHVIKTVKNGVYSLTNEYIDNLEACVDRETYEFMRKLGSDDVDGLRDVVTNIINGMDSKIGHYGYTTHDSDYYNEFWSCSSSKLSKSLVNNMKYMQEALYEYADGDDEAIKKLITGSISEVYTQSSFEFPNDLAAIDYALENTYRLNRGNYIGTVWINGYFGNYLLDLVKKHITLDDEMKKLAKCVEVIERTEQDLGLKHIDIKQEFSNLTAQWQREFVEKEHQGYEARGLYIYLDRRKSDNIRVKYILMKSILTIYKARKENISHIGTYNIIIEKLGLNICFGYDVYNNIIIRPAKNAGKELYIDKYM